MKKNKIDLRWDIALLSLILVIILAITSILYYNTERKRLIEAQFHELAIINNLKVNHIQSWMHNQLSSAQTYSNSPLFAETFNNYLDTHSVLLKNKLLERCKIINKFRSYRNIMIINTRGGIEISLFPEIKKLDTSTILYLRKVLNSRQASISNFSICPLDNKLYIDIISPIISNKNKLIGALILRSDPFLEIISNFRNDSAMKNNTESYLVFKKNKQFVILDNNPKSSDVLRLNKISDSHPLHSYFSQEANKYTGLNLQNEKVIAHIHPVPDLSWYILTQIKYNLVLSSFYSYVVFDTIITAILIILLLFSIVLIYQYRQKEIYKNMQDAELAFKEESERFRTTLYSIGDGVITTDKNGVVMRMNSEASRLTGWIEKEASGKHINEIFYILNEDTREKSECPVNKVLHDGVVVNMANHTILISLNGQEYPISDSGAPIRNEANEIIGVVLVFRDQTTQRSAEKRLKKSEANLRKAEFVSKSGHWELNLINNSVSLSEGAMQITGLQKNMCTLEEIKAVSLPENTEIYSNAIHLLTKKNKNIDLEIRAKNQLNGNIIYLHLIADYNASENLIFGIVQDITDYRTTLKKLHESQASLEEAQNISKVGSWEYDIIADKPSWSKEMFRIFERDPLLGEPSWEEHRKSILPDDWNIVDNAVQSAVLNGTSYNLEFRILHTNGEITWAKTIGKVLLDKNGKTEKLFGTVQDITERKRAEEAILMNKERWQNLFDNSPSAIAVYEAIDNGKDFVFSDFNITAQLTENYKRDQVIGKPISDLFPAAEELGFLDIFRKVWKTGKTEYMGTTRYADDKRDGWRENIIYRLNTGEVVAIYNDVTERMEAELKLVASEKKFRLLFENVSEPILLVTLNGQIIEANPAACSLLEYSFEELKKINATEINTPENKPKVKERFEKLIKNGSHFFETKLYSKSGKIVTLEVNSKLIEYENTKAILSVARDVSQRNASEKALRESEEKFRNIFENHSAIKLLLDPNTGDIVDANQAASDFYGWTLDELKKMNIQQINTLSISELFKNINKALIQKQTQYEFKHKLKDNTIRDVEVFSSIINIKNKNYLHSIVHDISKRKKAELALVESEYFLRKSQEVGKVGSYRLDIQRGLWTGSSELDIIFGIPENFRKDINSWYAIIHPDFKKEMTEYYEVQIIKQRNRFNKEYKIIRQTDKQERWVHGIGELEFDTDLNAVAMYGTILDITERKISELTLIENEKRLQYLLDSVTDYIYSVKIDNGKIIETKHGEGCKTITGYSSLEFSKDPNLWINIVYPNDKELVIEHSLKIINEQNIKPIEHRIVRKDGRIIWIRNTTALNHNKEGKLIGYDGLISEITEQKILEQKILTSVVETEEQERLAFSQELHDGLGPLISAIKMYVELLSMPNSENDNKNFLENAEKLIEEASSSIREISFKLSPHILQNYGIIEALKAYSEKVQKTKAIDISLNCNINCKLAIITETIIYRVLCECINNTLKHAHATKINLELNCNDYETLDVIYSDNGQGFDIDKIKREHKGVGLLNMESRIKSINGSIKINSYPGMGTYIHIRVRTSFLNV